MSNPFALLSLIVALPFLGMLFVFTAKSQKEAHGRNAFHVCVFTILANIVLIWRVFMLINEKSRALQLQEKFNWLSTPDINIVLAVDTFSLLLIAPAPRNECATIANTVAITKIANVQEEPMI